MKIKNVLLAIPLSLSLLAPVSAYAEKPDSYVVTQIKEHVKDEKVKQRLLDKVEKGELLDSHNPKKRSLGKVKQIDENTIETTYPDGSVSTESIDFSEATFYDENWKELPKEDVSTDGMVSVNSISGGTWTNGSGYSCVAGAKVSKSDYYISASFKADFCRINSGYDYISRVYGVDISADSWSILSQGVFRKYETVSYSAYGGVKFQAKITPDYDTTTEYLYLRVGGDKYWQQQSFGW